MNRTPKFKLNNINSTHIKKAFLNEVHSSQEESTVADSWVTNNISELSNIYMLRKRLIEWASREIHAYDKDTHIKEYASRHIKEDTLIPKQLTTNNIKIHHLLLGTNTSVYNEIVASIKKLEVDYIKDATSMYAYNTIENIKAINKEIANLNIPYKELYLSEVPSENSALDIYVSKIAILYYKLPDLIKEGFTISKEVYDKMMHTLNSNSINSSLDDIEGDNYRGSIYINRHATNNSETHMESDNNVVSHAMYTLNSYMYRDTNLTSYMNYNKKVHGKSKIVNTSYNMDNQGIDRKALHNISFNSKNIFGDITKEEQNINGDYCTRITRGDVSKAINITEQITLEDIIAATFSFDRKWKKYTLKPNKLNLYTSGNVYNYPQPLVGAGYTFIHSFETLLYGLLKKDLIIDSTGSIIIDPAFLNKADNKSKVDEYLNVTSKFSCLNTHISIVGEYYGNDTLIFNKNEYNFKDKYNHLETVYRQADVQSFKEGNKHIVDSFKYDTLEEYLYRGMGTNRALMEANYTSSIRDPYNLDKRLYLEIEYKAGTAIALLDVIANMCGVDNTLTYIAYLISMFDYFNIKAKELLVNKDTSIYNYDLMKAIIQPNEEIFELAHLYKVNQKHVSKEGKTLPKAFIRDIEQKALFSLLYSMTSFINTYYELTDDIKNKLTNSVFPYMSKPSSIVPYTEYNKKNISTLTSMVNQSLLDATQSDSSAIIANASVDNNLYNKVWDNYWGMYTGIPEYQILIHRNARNGLFKHIANIHKSVYCILPLDSNILISSVLNHDTLLNIAIAHSLNNSANSGVSAYSMEEIYGNITNCISTDVLPRLLKPNVVNYYTFKNVYDFYYKTPIMLTLGIDLFHKKAINTSFTIDNITKFYRTQGLLSSNISKSYFRAGTLPHINKTTYIPISDKNSYTQDYIRRLQGTPITAFSMGEALSINAAYMTINPIASINTYKILNNSNVNASKLIEYSNSDASMIGSILSLHDIFSFNLANSNTMSLNKMGMPCMFNRYRKEVIIPNSQTSLLQDSSIAIMLCELCIGTNTLEALPYSEYSVDINNYVDGISNIKDNYIVPHVNIPSISYLYMDKTIDSQYVNNPHQTGLINAFIDYTNFNDNNFKVAINNYVAELKQVSNSDSRLSDSSINNAVATLEKLTPKNIDIYKPYNSYVSITGEHPINDILYRTMSRLTNRQYHQYKQVKGIINSSLTSMLEYTKKAAVNIILENGICIEQDGDTYYIPSVDIPTTKGDDLTNTYMHNKYKTFRTVTFNSKEEIKEYIRNLFIAVYNREPINETAYVFDLIDKDIFYSKDFYAISVANIGMVPYIGMGETYKETFFINDASEYVSCIINRSNNSIALQQDPQSVGRIRSNYIDNDLYVTDKFVPGTEFRRSVNGEHRTIPADSGRTQYYLATKDNYIDNIKDSVNKALLNKEYITKQAKSIYGIPVETLYNQEQSIVNIDNNTMHKSVEELKRIGVDKDKLWNTYTEYFKQVLTYINNFMDENNIQYNVENDACKGALNRLRTYIKDNYSELLSEYNTYCTGISNKLENKEVISNTILEITIKLLMVESIRTSINLTLVVYNQTSLEEVNNNSVPIIPDVSKYTISDNNLFINPMDIYVYITTLITKISTMHNMASPLSIPMSQNYMYYNLLHTRDISNAVPSAILSSVFDYNLAGENTITKQTNKLDFNLDMLLLLADLINKEDTSNYSISKEEVYMKHKNMFFSKYTNKEDNSFLKLSYAALEHVDNLDIYSTLAPCIDGIDTYITTQFSQNSTLRDYVYAHIYTRLHSTSLYHLVNLIAPLAKAPFAVDKKVLDNITENLEYNTTYYNINKPECTLKDTEYNTLTNNVRALVDNINILNSTTRLLESSKLAIYELANTYKVSNAYTDSFYYRQLGFLMLLEYNKYNKSLLQSEEQSGIYERIRYSLMNSITFKEVSHVLDNNCISPYLTKEGNIDYKDVEDTIYLFRLYNSCTQQLDINNKYNSYKDNVMLTTSLVKEIQSERDSLYMPNSNIKDSFNKYMELNNSDNMSKDIIRHYYMKALYTPGVSALRLLHKIASHSSGLSYNILDKRLVNTDVRSGNDLIDTLFTFVDMNTLQFYINDSPVYPFIVPYIKDESVLFGFEKADVLTPVFDLIERFMLDLEIRIHNNTTDIIPSLIGTYFNWKHRYINNNFKDTYLTGSIPSLIESYTTNCATIKENQTGNKKVSNRKNSLSKKAAKVKRYPIKKMSEDSTTIDINKLFNEVPLTMELNNEHITSDAITDLLKPRILPNNIFTGSNDSFPSWTTYIPELLESKDSNLDTSIIMGKIITPWIYKFTDIINSHALISKGLTIVNEGTNIKNLAHKGYTPPPVGHINTVYNFNDIDNLDKLFNEIKYENNKLSNYIRYIEANIPGNEAIVRLITELHDTIINMIYISAMFNLSIFKGILRTHSRKSQLLLQDLKEDISSDYYMIYETLIDALSKNTLFHDKINIILKQYGSSNKYNKPVLESISAYEDVLGIANFTVGVTLIENILRFKKGMLSNKNILDITESKYINIIKEHMNKISAQTTNVTLFNTANVKPFYEQLNKDIVLTSKINNTMLTVDIGSIHLTLDITDNNLSTFLKNEGLPANNINVLVLWNKDKPNIVYPFLYYYGIHLGVPSVYILNDRSNYTFILDHTNFNTLIHEVLNISKLEFGVIGANELGNEQCTDTYILHYIKNRQAFSNLFTWTYRKEQIDDSNNLFKIYNNSTHLIDNIEKYKMGDLSKVLENNYKITLVKDSDEESSTYILEDNIEDAFPFVLAGIRNGFNGKNIPVELATLLLPKNYVHENQMGTCIADAMLYNMRMVNILTKSRTYMYKSTRLVDVGDTDLTQITPKKYDVPLDTLLVDSVISYDSWKVLSYPTYVGGLSDNKVDIIKGEIAILDDTSNIDTYGMQVTAPILEVGYSNDNIRSLYAQSTYMNGPSESNISTHNKVMFNNKKKEFGMKMQDYKHTNAISTVCKRIDRILKFNDTISDYTLHSIQDILEKDIAANDTISLKVGNRIQKYVSEVFRFYFIESRLYGLYEYSTFINRLYELLYNTREATYSDQDSVNTKLVEYHSRFEGLLLSNSGNIPKYNRGA